MSLPPLVSEVSLRSVGSRAAGNSYRTEVSRHRFFRRQGATCIAKRMEWVQLNGRTAAGVKITESISVVVL